MKTSESITEITKALINFQAQVPTMPKDAIGHGYNYTPLDTVVKTIRPLLTESGLAFVQFPANSDGAGVALTTRLLHNSGEWMEDTLLMPLPALAKGNEAQAYGAGLTYARRYALTSILGIVADEDIDAAIKPKTKPPQSKRSPRDKPAANGNRPTHAMLKDMWISLRANHAEKAEEIARALIKKHTNDRTESSKEMTVDEYYKVMAELEPQEAE